MDGFDQAAQDGRRPLMVPRQVTPNPNPNPNPSPDPNPNPNLNPNPNPNPNPRPNPTPDLSWYPGRVLAVRLEHRCLVAFDDGDYEDHVLMQHVRPLSAEVRSPLDLPLTSPRSPLDLP